MMAKLVAHAVAWPLALLPLSIQNLLGAVLGTAMRLALAHRRRIVRANLEIAFPEKDPAERERILRAHFRHLGHIALDMLQQPAFRFRPLLWRKVKPVGWEHLQAALARGPSAVLLCAHLGSWDLGAAVATMDGVRLISVYKKARGFADDLLLEIRRGLPQELVSKHEAQRPLIKGARSGALLGLIADQGGHDRYPFFGRETVFPEGPGHFVAKYGSIPVPCWSIRQPDGSYQTHCLEPLELDEATRADPRAVKEAVIRWYIGLLEDWVRRYPEQYYWVHDMWRLYKDD